MAETETPIELVHANQNLVADDTTSDYDDGTIASSTQSLSDSVREHVYENGRRYHLKSQGKYALPTDEAEQDRLDLQHHMYLELLGGQLSLIPFKQSPHNVLDCGCGTGIWALDFGEQHEASQVIGVDMAPIQPSWTYPNVRFEVDDLEKDWTYKDNFFNYIHSRDLIMGIKDWPRYFRQMYKAAAPGADIEISEQYTGYFACDDDSMPEDSALRKWSKGFVTAMEKMGVHPYNTGEDYKRMLGEAGFVDVHLRKFKVPLGHWPRNRKSKYLGRVVNELSTTGFEAYGQAMLTNFAGFDADEAGKLIQECVETIRSSKQHVYFWVYHLTARKPE